MFTSAHRVVNPQEIWLGSFPREREGTAEDRWSFGCCECKMPIFPSLEIYWVLLLAVNSSFVSPTIGADRAQYQFVGVCEKSRVSYSTLGVRYTATQLKSCDLLQKLACQCQQQIILFHWVMVKRSMEIGFLLRWYSTILTQLRNLSARPTWAALIRLRHQYSSLVAPSRHSEKSYFNPQGKWEMNSAGVAIIKLATCRWICS